MNIKRSKDTNYDPHLLIPFLFLELRFKATKKQLLMQIILFLKNHNKNFNTIGYPNLNSAF